MHPTASPRRQIVLEFTAPPSGPEDDKPRRFRESLSAVEVTDHGRTLFLGVDETIAASPTIERLSAVEGGYGAHESLLVQDFLDLPDDSVRKGRVGEVDIEGLAIAGSFLWVVGSHSARRKKPKHRSEEEDLARLARVELEANRLLLGRIPIVERTTGTTLVRRDGARQSAQLVEDLRDALADDPLVGPFLRTYRNDAGDRVSIPGKENGFDIEGIAVRPGPDDTCSVFLGLRGPVLRGFATVLEIAVAPRKKADELVLHELPGTQSKKYRRHLLDLDGLGIRDLRSDGDNLLILAGPTMTLNGETNVYRWVGGLTRKEESLTRRSSGELDRLLRLPYGDGDDRPEGFTVLPSGELLVVYDKPAEARLRGDDGAMADVFAQTSGDSPT
jgi:hypothetical protein